MGVLINGRVHKLYPLEIFVIGRQDARCFLQFFISTIAPVSPTTTSTISLPDGMTLTWFFLVCLFCWF